MIVETIERNSPPRTTQTELPTNHETTELPPNALTKLPENSP